MNIHIALTFMIAVVATPSSHFLFDQSPNSFPIEDQSRKITRVPEGVQVIQEKTLFLDGSIANLNPDKVASHRDGYLSTDMTSSGRAALQTRNGMIDMETDSSNGIRLYSFIVQPKEKLRFKLKSEDSKLIMRFLTPTTQDVFTKEIRRANIAPAPLRRSRIAISNNTGKIVEAVLMLTGPVNYSYRVDIQREMVE